METTRPNKAERAIELRKAGYSYAAIALTLYSEGYTETEVSKQRTYSYIREVAPELVGSVKRKLKAPRLIKRSNLVNE